MKKKHIIIELVLSIVPDMDIMPSQSVLGFFYGESVESILGEWHETAKNWVTWHLSSSYTMGHKLNVYCLELNGTHESLKEDSEEYRLISATLDNLCPKHS